MACTISLYISYSSLSPLFFLLPIDFCLRLRRFVGLKFNGAPIVDASINSRHSGDFVLMAETVKYMISQLRPQDRVCLIVMNDDKVKTLPLTLMNPRGKKSIDSFIAQLIPSGDPQTSAALTSAKELMEASNTSLADVVFFLISNGNFDDDRKDDTLWLVQDEFVAQSATINTIALGLQPRIESMSRLAMNTHGSMYEIPSFSETEEVCQSLFAAMSQPVLERAFIEVRVASDDVILNAIDATYSPESHQDKRGFSVTLRNWRFGETREVAVISCFVPSATAANVDILSFSVTYQAAPTQVS
jgi:hypothetical protein